MSSKHPTVAASLESAVPVLVTAGQGADGGAARDNLDLSERWASTTTSQIPSTTLLTALTTPAKSKMVRTNVENGKLAIALNWSPSNPWTPIANIKVPSPRILLAMALGSCPGGLKPPSVMTTTTCGTVPRFGCFASSFCTTRIPVFVNVVPPLYSTLSTASLSTSFVVSSSIRN